MRRDFEPSRSKPLRTSLALLGVGALAIGGVAIALPRLSPHPSPTTVVATTSATTLSAPFPNGGNGAMGASTGGAPTTNDDSTSTATTVAQNAAGTSTASGQATGQGGGPPAMDEEARDDAGVMTAPPARSNAIGGNAPRTTGDNGAQPAVVGVPIPVGGVGGVAGATTNMATGAPVNNPINPATNPTGMNGGTNAGVSTLGSGDAGATTGPAANDTTGGAAAGDAGAGGLGSNSSALSAGSASGAAGVSSAGGDLSQLAYPLPAYAAPPASTSTSGPVTNGAAGSTAPLWGLAGGGGVSTGGSSSGGNSGVVNPVPSITATLLVSMSQGDDPERAWTSMSPYLRSGDMVIARVSGDASSGSVALVGWSDRVRTDTPLVTYALAVNDATRVKSMLAKGLPATLDTIGPAQTDGLDLATMTSLSSAVRGAGKHFFVSVSSGSKVPLAQVGAKADVVELVIAATDAVPASTEASLALASLRSAGNPLVFVRLPSPSLSSTTTTTSFLGTMQQRMPNVGFALPVGTSTTTLSDLRASP